MPRKSNKAKLFLSEQERFRLKKLSQARNEPLLKVQRAKILIKYSLDITITNIQKELNVSRQTIYKIVDRALAFGVEEALKDKYHRPYKPIITREAKLFVTNLACEKPMEYGYAAELWSLSKLAKHCRKHGPAAGYPCLGKAVKATIHRILKENSVQPHKMRYYLEKRDKDFERKMREVLMVYKEINMQNDESNERKIITVSVDEKPGVQAIQNVAPDLLPKPGKHPQIARDYEYKRLGTLSILASLDLHTGYVLAEVQDRHRSREFIMLLKNLDDYYPKDAQIRIILDNHSSHISKETMAYLSTRPNRFIYVHTPTHGSWLNLVETLFSKMARTFLKRIRVNSKEELKERILKGIEEINSDLVIHRWKKFDLLGN